MVFPGVAASWSPQLEFFVSKGILATDWFVLMRDCGRQVLVEAEVLWVRIGIQLLWLEFFRYLMWSDGRRQGGGEKLLASYKSCLRSRHA